MVTPRSSGLTPKTQLRLVNLAIKDWRFPWVMPNDSAKLEISVFNYIFTIVIWDRRTGWVLTQSLDVTTEMTVLEINTTAACHRHLVAHGKSVSIPWIIIAFSFHREIIIEDHAQPQQFHILFNNDLNVNHHEESDSMRSTGGQSPIIRTWYRG